MSINAYWDDVDSEIMRIDYEGEWTLEDQVSVSKRSKAMLGDDVRRNDVIVCVHDNAHFPKSLPQKDIHHIVQDITTNPGVRVFVGAPVIMQTVLDLFSGTLGGKMGVEITTAKSIDSARSLIRRKRREQGK